MSGNTQTVLADEAGIARAAEILRGGGLVAVPTETVYGLAARADSAEAVAAIYRAKGRPDFNPLIVHVPSLEAARRYAEIDERAALLAKRFWPGPLTMVVRARADSPVVPAVTAGLPTIALRSPAHPVTRALLKTLDLPVAAPSANLSLGVSPTMPAHVAASLGENCPPILDGGRCEAGLESSIVALREDGAWSLLRPGPIGADEVADLLGQAPVAVSPNAIEAPGQMARHYSPGKPVRLGATQARPDEFHIGFGEIAGDVSLSGTGDLAHAAARLYDCLHQAGASGKPRVAVAPIPAIGIGAAINDRLRRAAAR